MLRYLIIGAAIIVMLAIVAAVVYDKPRPDACEQLVNRCVTHRAQLDSVGISQCSILLTSPMDKKRKPELCGKFLSAMDRAREEER